MLEETPRVLGSNGGQCFRLSPLGEVVYCYYHEFLLGSSLWKRTQDVDPPLGKWTGGNNVSNFHGGSARNLGEFLTFVACLYEIVAVSADRGPVESGTENMRGHG